MPPVITTSTRLAWANAWATSRELVTTVRPGTRASRRASSCVVVPAPTTMASPSSTRRGGEIGDGRLLRGREMGFLRKAGLPRETARQYRTAVPAVEESFCLQRPHVPPYGHFGGLDDAGELTERYRPVGPHHFEDQLATFCSEHETDSNPNDRQFSAALRRNNGSCA